MSGPDLRGTQRAEARVNVPDLIDLVVTRVLRILEETGPRFPLFVEAPSNPAAQWTTTADGNWCAGYWIGLLWLAAKHARDDSFRDRFLDAAYSHLPQMLAQPRSHLFAGLNHNYAGFLGFEVTGDAALTQVGLDGADAMRTLFDERAGQIPIGDYQTWPSFGPKLRSSMPADRRNVAAVDAIHTSVPILWRAHELTQEPEYREIAEAHVARHIDWHIRKDGSTTQMTQFEIATGLPLETFNPLAASPDGCWSRGLAWNIAGLAEAYVHTQDSAVLETLRLSARYYRGKADPELIPSWDLALPRPHAYVDASAAAVTAYGLLLLKRQPDSGAGDLVSLGMRVLAALVDQCVVTDHDSGNAGAVLHGCYRVPGRVAVDSELIWSDFYLLAALDLLSLP